MPSKAELRQKWNNMEKDTVVLHMLNRSKNKPSSSPFVIKLETYLRAAGITYVEDFEQPFSSKSKSPWITVNGEDVEDSQFAVEYLAEKLDKDLSKNLTPEQKATERAYRIMLEDNFYFAMLSLNMAFNRGRFIKADFPPLPAPGFLQGFAFNMVVKSLTKQAHAQGMGRHSKEEVERIAVDDLAAVSALLGDNDYFFGGSDPVLLDVVVFAFMSSVTTGEVAESLPFKKKVDEELNNLKLHFERMKARYWADWNEKVYVDEKAKRREEEKKKKEEEEERKKKEKEEAEEKKKKEEEEKKEKKEKEEEGGKKEATEKKEGEENKEEE
jgi:hypothetical protein